MKNAPTLKSMASKRNRQISSNGTGDVGRPPSNSGINDKRAKRAKSGDLSRSVSNITHVIGNSAEHIGNHIGNPSVGRYFSSETVSLRLM